MTRQEQAKFKRLEKRRENLFTAIAIIKTLLSFHDDPKEMLYRIGKIYVLEGRQALGDQEKK